MFLAIMVVFVVIVVTTLLAGVKTVPQGHEYVVQRLGKYHSTLKPGLSIIIPYMDQVAYTVLTKDEPLNIEQQEAITRDNAVILCTAITFVKVVDPVKAVYGISDYRYAIKNMVMTNLRSIIGSMTLNDALSSRDRIKALLKEQISNEVTDWGLVVKSVEIQDIRPSGSMQEAMEKQAGAERLKQAVILEAEGKKEAAVLEAEGRLLAARKEAEAQISLAKASAEAITNIREAIGSNELPALFLLGDRYIESFRKLAASSNAKTMILPADILGAVKGLIGRKEI
jgi:regulator of protease activity HflC (stomatin/prohibitin superfamily)